LVSQIIEVYRLKPKSVLEIGIGNGFVSSYLRASGIEVVTFDINESLSPTVVGNILEIEKHFDENSFDLILCAEVLEHIPFEHFESIIGKLQKISKKNMVLTIPRSMRIILDLVLRLKIPFIPYIEKSIFLTLRSSEVADIHHWQVDFKEGFKLKDINRIIEKKFKILKSYSEKGNRTHQFFILEKKN
jgi:ubiquinone/menaquinone biosynthesis C-methylase UbiE